MKIKSLACLCISIIINYKISYLKLCDDLIKKIKIKEVNITCGNVVCDRKIDSKIKFILHLSHKSDLIGLIQFYLKQEKISLLKYTNADIILIFHNLLNCDFRIFFS